ncbi:hypothetical protein HXX76_002895 [Chlamydomonas incerta]|uniref:BACK domain-containing protein n=1 Tax=Chlamydomonas incerta TaxID=51695 RepID=A0A835TEV9_CHLIN|nr:hypothetical protein HXX76_002895 [Chlamydomonas incerta]|eukprot:KAG2442816.1 hypothetical protein HXX76_002895 [Chlamydomonas incerta]
MLGGEEELPAASAAIQFAYTGRVQPGISVREALQVRQQAAYLLLDGCVEACVEVIRGALVQGSAGSGSLAATACAAASGSGSVAATTGAAAAGSGNAAATTFAAAAGSGSAAATAVAAAAGSGNAAAAASAAAAGSGNATAATTGAAAAGSGNATAATTGAAAAGSGNAAVLELYSCAALWPDPAENAAFAALLTEAKRRMVAHFGDALAVLNNKERYEQMVALPAVGLEALLESDDFGTDSESSVVLLLAEWMAANHASTDEALRRRLCGLLRLAQCSRAYLAGVLPVLAARHQRSPASAAGWFPMSVTEATCMLAYSTASEPERKAMSAEGQAWGPCAGMATMPVGWRNTQPRRQRLPADGRSFDFSAGLTEMEKSFGALKPGEEGLLYPRLPGSRLGDVVVAQGLEWQPFMKWVSGASTAGVFASPREPAALAATAASRTAAAEGELLTGAVAAVPRMRLSVSGAAGQHSWSGRYDAAAVVRIWCGWGWAEALKLHEAATNQQPNGSNGTGSNVNSKLAARWAPYLQGGTRLEGSMVLLPPAS